MRFSEEFVQSTKDSLIECVNSASEEIIKIYRSDNFEKTDKKDGSPLTAADKASNEIILDQLNKITPSIQIISEETFETSILKELPELYWLVDPLDGTREFINKTDEFTVNIASVSYTHLTLPTKA